MASIVLGGNKVLNNKLKQETLLHFCMMTQKRLYVIFSKNSYHESLKTVILWDFIQQ
jgi:hypothetical protein